MKSFLKFVAESETSEEEPKSVNDWLKKLKKQRGGVEDKSKSTPEVGSEPRRLGQSHMQNMGSGKGRYD